MQSELGDPLGNGSMQGTDRYWARCENKRLRIRKWENEMRRGLKQKSVGKVRIPECSLVTLVSCRQTISAASSPKMRPMATAAQLAGSWHATPGMGLRIPLIFQLTTRNILGNRRNSHSAPRAGKQLAAPLGCLTCPASRAHLRRRSRTCHRNVKRTRGGASSPLILIGGKKDRMEDESGASD